MLYVNIPTFSLQSQPSTGWAGKEMANSLAQFFLRKQSIRNNRQLHLSAIGNLAVKSHGDKMSISAAENLAVEIAILVWRVLNQPRFTKTQFSINLNFFF